MQINSNLIKNRETIGNIKIHFLKNSFEAGILFAKNSLGNFADINYWIDKEKLYLEVFLQNPVFASLGMQMAFEKNNMLLSGPARAILKKPKKIFEKLNFSNKNFDKLNFVMCIEEENEIIASKKIIDFLDEHQIKQADILVLKKNDFNIQAINILSRAIEIVILRMFLDNAKFNIQSAKSICFADLKKINKYNDISFYLNDCLRYNADVRLFGNIEKQKLDKYITANSKYKNTSFAEIYKKAGSIKNIDIGAFSVKSVKYETK